MPFDCGGEETEAPEKPRLQRFSITDVSSLLSLSMATHHDTAPGALSFLLSAAATYIFKLAHRFLALNTDQEDAQGQ